MFNASRRLLALGVLFGAAACAAIPASAQTTTEETPADRQLARIDFAVNGAGIFTTNTAGTNYLAQNLSRRASNTAGFLGTLRYIRSPFVGFEGNFGYARYTEAFTLSNTSATPPNQLPLSLPVQTNVKEYTVGYAVHTPKLYYGLQPFASAGTGAFSFKPTGAGGQGLPTQVSRAFYYGIGVQTAMQGTSHFGVRVGLRQVYFLAPDFFANYLLDSRHAFTTEPTVGFVVRF